MPTVLCVDDDRNTLQTLFFLLDAKGFEFIGADNAAAAESLLRTKKIDLVILDHGLPETNGATLAKQFKQIKDVPVLMLTGRVEAHELEGLDGGIKERHVGERVMRLVHADPRRGVDADEVEHAASQAIEPGVS